MIGDDLTPQQRLFCREYVNNGSNSTQAAITAGYSENTASVQGSRLLSNVKIQDYIAELSRKSENRALMTRDDLIDFYVKRFKFNPTDIIGVERITKVGRGGKAYEVDTMIVKPSTEWPKEISPYVQKIKQGQFGVEVEFTDIMKHAEALGKIFGINAPEELKVEVTNPAQLAAELSELLKGKIDGNKA